MASFALTTLQDDSDRKSPATLSVDVIADLICPWCYLGKRRLDQALSAVHGPVAVSWFPFQINPAMPQSGMALDEYFEKRFGNSDKLQSTMDDLQRIGAAAGVTFNFDKLQRVPNTLDAHRLMKLAETEKADPSGLAESILRGFFADGLDLADRDVLIEIGDENGLSRSEIGKTLDNDLSRRIVLSQEAEVRKSGVVGVPDFLINKRLLAVGAQSTGDLVAIFDRAMFGEDSDLPVSPVVH